MARKATNETPTMTPITIAARWGRLSESTEGVGVADADERAGVVMKEPRAEGRLVELY